MQVPLFAKWGRALLRRLMAATQSVMYHKEDLVYKTGEISQFVYIVKEGEFELLADVQLTAPKEKELSALIGPPHARRELQLFMGRIAGNRHKTDLELLEDKHTLLVPRLRVW